MLLSSTPKTSLNSLYQNYKEVNGEVVLDYESHELEKSKYFFILKKHSSLIKNAYLRQKFESLVHLGCSPKIKI